jgi:NitT/TauT family transport system substrate-binding protein
MHPQLADPRVRRALTSYHALGGPHNFNSVLALGRYCSQNLQIIAGFMAALDRAMAMIKNDPDGMAALWIEDQRSRLPKEDVVRIVRDPENVWTTKPMKIMAFAEFMHRTSGIRAKPDRWQDVYVEDIAGLAGS